MAIRIILLEAEADAKAWAKGTDRFRGNVALRNDSYTFNNDRTILKLTNRYSPIIIEAGRMADHPSLESFERMILQSQLTVHRTVVTRDTGVVVVYKSAAPDMAEIVFNAANTSDVPTVGSKYVDYEHPKVFDSPYIQSDYDSGLVEICKGEHKLSLDFNNGIREECENISSSNKEEVADKP